jgi:peptidoglycan/xylan/chitin deacetylase (PgdA/CDA1 family)
MVVLTFDQGPGATTGKVLDILSRRNIPAAFHFSTELFRNVTWRGYVRRAALEGHLVGIYVPGVSGGNSSPGTTAAGLADDDTTDSSDEYDALIYQRISKSYNWITSVTGKPPIYIRFGQKSVSQSTKRLADSFGLQATRPRFEIRDESNKMDVIWNSINRAFNGSDPAQHSFIIKLRDIMPNMVASLDRLIDYVEERGFRFVPLDSCQPVPDRLVHFKTLKATLGTQKATARSATSNHAVRTHAKLQTQVLTIFAVITWLLL